MRRLEWATGQPQRHALGVQPPDVRLLSAALLVEVLHRPRGVVVKLPLLAVGRGGVWRPALVCRLPSRRADLRLCQLRRARHEIDTRRAISLCRWAALPLSQSPRARSWRPGTGGRGCAHRSSAPGGLRCPRSPRTHESPNVASSSMDIRRETVSYLASGRGQKETNAGGVVRCSACSELGRHPPRADHKKWWLRPG